MHEDDMSMIIEVEKSKLTSNVRLPKSSRKRTMSDDDEV